MALTRRIARPLLASIFIAGGIDALRDPEGKAKAAQAVTVPLTRRVPALPDDPELLVQINGAVQVGAGVLLATGRCRRLAALALIGSIVPTTYAGHRFWEEDDAAVRAEQQAHFLKNLGLLGGLILAAFDTEGAPSLGWRARRRAARIGAAVAVGKAVSSSSATATGSSVADSVAVLAHHAKDVAAEVGRHLDDGASLAGRQAQDVAARAARQADVTGRHLADILPGAGQQLAETLAVAGQRAADSVGRFARTGAGTVTPHLATGADRAGDLVDRAHDLLDR
jgi:uncharacterized membrane protein YphA (DoxX/SURF4 family)